MRHRAAAYVIETGIQKEPYSGRQKGVVAGIAKTR